MKSRGQAESYILAETDSRGKLSQRARILQLLMSDYEIGLPQVLDLRISQYNARITELRALGYDIRNRVRHVGREVQSWYWIVFGRPQSRPSPEIAPPLFDDGKN